MALIRDRNQLLFNLGHSEVPVNSISKSDGATPRPIVIEKVTVATTPVKRAVQPIQFTALSAESLSRAVDIARSDLKKLKQEEEQQAVALGATQARTHLSVGVEQASRGRPPIAYSNEYKNRVRRRQQRPPFQVIVTKERPQSKAVQSDGTQTSERRIAAALRRRDLSSLPRRSQSPPTRDVWARQPSHEEKVFAEIGRLRVEMLKCLQQIQSIIDAGETHVDRGYGVVGQGRGAAVGPRLEDEDIDVGQRRLVRTEERATRMGREIYRINRQMCDLEADVTRLDTPEKLLAKKVHLIGRLSTLHRGVVKALQLLVQQITDQRVTSLAVPSAIHDDPSNDVTEGHRGDDSIAKGYHALSIIIRQLSACCERLEVSEGDAGRGGGSAAVVDKLLDDMKPALVRDSRAIYEVQEEPLSQRQKVFINQRSQPKDDVVKQEQGVNCHSPQAVKITRNAHGLRYRADGRFRRPEFSAADSRKATLTAGLRAILQDGGAGRSVEGQPQDRALEPDVGERPRKGVMWQMQAANNRSVLVDRRRPGKRRTRIRPSQVPVNRGPLKYAAPTVSTRIKEKDLAKGPPSFPQPGTPRSGHDQHITAQDHQPGPSQFQTHPYKLRDTQFSQQGGSRIGLSFLQPVTPQRSVKSSPAQSRSVSPERFSSPRRSRSMSPGDISPRSFYHQGQRRRSLDREERSYSQRWEESSGRPISSRDGRVPVPAWRDDEEIRIRNRMEQIDFPVEDHLTHAVVDDIIEDVAREIHAQRVDGYAAEHARRMHGAPTLETVLQRLRLMELEQNEIRTRWGTMVFDEELRGSGRLSHGRSRSPSPVTFAGGSQQRNARRSISPMSRHNGEEEVASIMFTKSNRNGQMPPSSVANHRYPPDNTSTRFTATTEPLMYAGSTTGAASRISMMTGRGSVQLNMSSESLKNIEKYREKFRMHLRKQNNESSGNFNPWIVVEQIADDIVDHCVSAVCEEVEEINRDIVDHVYRSEFASGETN